MSKKKKLTLGGSALVLASTFISPWEGRINIPYYDIAGVLTVCNGITGSIELKKIYSDQECDALLTREINRAADAVDRLIYTPMPDTRKAALISFTYNLGEGALAKSTLRKKMNRGDIKGACNELLRWNRAGGKVVNGLTRRRKAERNLCLVGEV